MDNPIHVQRVQTGLISSDKNYQTQRQNPELQQRIFEEEVQKRVQEAQNQTQSAAKTDKAHIKNDKEKQARDNDGKSEAKQKKEKPRELAAKTDVNKIEKDESGQILHLDVKI